MSIFERLVIKYLRLITAYVAVSITGLPSWAEEARGILKERHDKLSDESGKFLSRR